MPAADPTVVAVVVVDVEVETEPVLVEPNRAVEIGDGQHDRRQPVHAVGHRSRLPRPGGFCTMRGPP